LKASEVLHLERQLNDTQEKFERLNEENQGIIEGLEEDNDDLKFNNDTLQSELSKMKNEMIAVTDAKDKLIEEAHEKIASLESDDSSEEILVIKADNEAQRLKIIELTSQIEQSREQKISCDLHLTNINDALENVKLQLSEREAEIAQLEDVIKQKTKEEAREKEAIRQTVSYIMYFKFNFSFDLE
jgi:chromosome segregation ATPase